MPKLVTKTSAFLSQRFQKAAGSAELRNGNSVLYDRCVWHGGEDFPCFYFHVL
eukprot:m.193547 g.193547  ORF g.193547 m.193547 type:complete len:53 (-) comp25777_c0_seq10:790-948(-)